MNLKQVLLISLLCLCLFGAIQVFAQAACAPGVGSTTLCNPIPSKDIGSFAVQVLVVFASFTTIIPIMAVAFAGFLMLISQGNPEGITRAKQTLTWAILGFVLAVCSYILIAAMVKFIGADSLGSGSTNPNSPGTIVNNPLRDLDFANFLKTLIVNFLQIVGVIAILILIMNGFRYITASGNEERTTQAKEGLKWAIGGLIVVLLAYVIVRATATLLGLP